MESYAKLLIIQINFQNPEKSAGFRKSTSDGLFVTLQQCSKLVYYDYINNINLKIINIMSRRLYLARQNIYKIQHPAQPLQWLGWVQACLPIMGLRYRLPMV
ncbi:MAG TPA: hypothetical protein VF629_14275 [Hymenobacter sp.]|uniref:hypothetical protein n=1 Tax=Hymenobacter sp. TaxID=1898978 RepID=UPI002ED98E93